MCGSGENAPGRPLAARSGIDQRPLELCSESLKAFDQALLPTACSPLMTEHGRKTTAGWLLEDTGLPMASFSWGIP